MSMRRCFRLISPPIVLLFVLGCGGGEEVTNETVKDVNPDKVIPSYFPMTVGSRWVYRNLDGFEWVREVREAKEIGFHLYHVFNYVPPLEDTQFEFLKTPTYATAPNRLLLLAENEIDDAIRQVIQQVNEFYLGYYKTKVVSDGELTMLRLPLSAGRTWDALNISLRGGEGYFGFRHSFEANWVVSGTSGYRETVETPAGSFEDCLKIQYETRQSVEFKWDANELDRRIWDNLWRDREEPLREGLQSVFSNLMPNLKLETVWLAPGVGPVKIESAERTAELIEYHLAEER